MLKRSVIVATLVAGLALGGCANLAEKTNDITQQVQANANVLCGFVPTAATIAAFIPGFGTAAASAATIATGICQAIRDLPVNTVEKSRHKSIVSSASTVDVSVGSVVVPGRGLVPIVGHFTR